MHTALLVTLGGTPDLHVPSRPGPDEILSLHTFPHIGGRCVTTFSDTLGGRMSGIRQLPPVTVPAGVDLGAVGTVTGAETRLDELRAMRAVMAKHIDSENTLARDLAALVRQLRDVSREIEELEAVERAAEVEAVTDDTADAPFTLAAI